MYPPQVKQVFPIHDNPYPADSEIFDLLQQSPQILPIIPQPLPIVSHILCMQLKTNDK